MEGTIKERLVELVKKLLSVKIIIGIPLFTVLVILGTISGEWFVVGVLAIFGIREVGKKFTNGGQSTTVHKE